MYMENETTIPKRANFGEKVMVNLLEGSTEVLKGMAEDAGFANVSAYARGLLEREIKVCRPVDFERIRGTG